MKHLRRWLICLAFLLNVLAFIAFIALGWVDKRFFLAALACYPLSLLFIFLARKYINAKCTFCRTQKWADKWDDEPDSIKWMILKTVLMPIASATALIMFHLIAITYRKTNEAIEDRFGFSISSIFRTLIGAVTYFIITLIIYLILILIFDLKSKATTEISGEIFASIFLLGGIIWLASHILWDVLDFADKEGNLFILIKNIVFLGIGILCILIGFLAFAIRMNNVNTGAEINFRTMCGTFCFMITPLAMHMAYYGVIRTERPPQSKMTFFWGPIAAGIITIYSLIVGAIAQHGRAWAIIFYIITIAAYVAIIYFFKMPFRYRDGQYRLDYREYAKEKRIARANAASERSSSVSDRYSPNTLDDAQIYDIAFKVKGKPRIYISSIAQLDDERYYIEEATKDRIIYVLCGTLNIDFRGVKPDAQSSALNGIKRDVELKFNKESNKLISKTRKELASKGLNSNMYIGVRSDIDTNIRT